MRRNNAVEFVATLRDALEKEAAILRERRYRNLAELNEKKRHLISAIEGKMPKLSGDEETRALIASLEALTKKAKENAEHLAMVRRGMTNARARLDALSQAEADTGLYTHDGKRIDADGPSSVARSI